MFGYLIASIIINFLSGIVTWRFAIQIQGIAQIPIALYFYFEDENLINIDTTKNFNEDDNFISSDTIRKENKHFTERPITDTPTLEGNHSKNHNFKEQLSKSKNFLKRQNTRIDTVETSDLGKYCSQVYVI
jgi:hypothetical protein